MTPEEYNKLLDNNINFINKNGSELKNFKSSPIIPSHNYVHELNVRKGTLKHGTFKTDDIAKESFIFKKCRQEWVKDSLETREHLERCFKL
jgi:hypothetical protein